MQLFIGIEELQDRQQRVKEYMEENQMQAFVTFSSLSIFYLTGFHFISTERPAGLILPLKGPSFLLAPLLEKEHSKEALLLDEVITYPEYPGIKPPMEYLAEALQERGLKEAHLALESKAYSSPMGYRGPLITDLLPQLKITMEGDLLEDMRKIKSAQEIELMKESARWGNLAHALLQEYSGSGKNENEVSFRACQEATFSMMKALGPGYTPIHFVGAKAGFRSQIGKNSALPHAVNVNMTMQPGDTLVTGASADVGGYLSELERTMFLGPPSLEQKKYFSYMMEMMEVAFEKIRPGYPCSEVDTAVRKVYEKYKIMDLWRHHTGHALGLLGHEAPFFDTGDDTIMEPGMVFSVEPGIYVEGLGGFRHSDTLVITEDGMEMLTYYPRDLEDLIIPV